MAPHARGRDLHGRKSRPRWSESSGRRLDPTNTWRSGSTQADLKLAVARAFASVEDRLPPRDWAEPLIDMVGWLLGNDEGVATESIDAIAASIGEVIAAIAHAARSKGPPS
jgi:hypothetical protein